MIEDMNLRNLAPPRAVMIAVGAHQPQRRKAKTVRRRRKRRTPGKGVRQPSAKVVPFKRAN
jgi:hypothetical protein